jgi:hypothetical protein
LDILDLAMEKDEKVDIAVAIMLDYIPRKVYIG